MSIDLVYGFGSNKWGELGLGHNKEVTELTIIPELCKKQIIEFNDGFGYCTALSRDGKVYTFGLDVVNQLGHKNKKTESEYIKPNTIETLYNEFVEQISCGFSHAIVLTRNQEVYGWGDNRFGQIGVNSEENTQSIAANIKGFNEEKIQSISCGSEHSMALTVNGNAFSWGRNDCGQLGINSKKDSYSPKMIKFSDKTVLIDRISCGCKHSLLLSKNGEIYSFGSNKYNQLGYKTRHYIQLIPRKIQIKPKINFSEVFCHSNRHFSTGLTSNNKLCYNWGKCGVKGNIEYPEETEYNSCIKAVNSFISNDFPIKTIESRIETKNYYENTFNEIKRLGSGSYGEVFEAENKLNKRCFAIKKIKLSDEQIKEGKDLREIEFLSTLKSEYVVEYENAWIETDKQSNIDYILYIEMELCLKTLKELNTELMTELQCKHSLVENLIGFYILSELLTEVIEGVNYLHKNNIIHRDLKQENILISDFKRGRIVRIADFGNSCIHRTQFQNNEEIGISHTGEVGEISYMAPELRKCSDRLSGRLEYSYKVDIYSLGKLFNNLTLLNHGLSIDSLKSKLQSLKQINEKMISERPEDRPDCKELLKNLNKYFMNLLDLNEFEDICDYLKNDEKKYKTFYMKYIEDKLYYHLFCGKTIPKNIIFLFSNILCLPMFESYHNGREHCIARTVDGKLYSFGSNEFNQLGYQRENDDDYRPKLIEILNNENVIQVSCGDYHTLIVTIKREIYGWGDNRLGQIGNNIDVKTQLFPIKITNFNNEIIKSVCCGSYHSMALTVNGSVYSWGYNHYGQLGLDSETNCILIPTKITKFNNEKVLSISSGSDYSMALTDKGNVFGWGQNYSVQLGLKNNSNVLYPQMINDTKILFKKIICKRNQSILLSTNDDIYVFDFNQFNQYYNERPDDQILITQMIDKRHPLITFPENKSNFIPSLPMLVLSELWLKYYSVFSSEYVKYKMNTIEKMKRSFLKQNWNHKIPVNYMDLAESGFYYTRIEDKFSYFQFNKNLYKLQADYDKKCRHALFNRCKYLKSKQFKFFIDYCKILIKETEYEENMINLKELFLSN